MRGEMVGEGNGKAIIIPGGDVVANSKKTWKIVYTVGEKGIKNGGGIRVEIPYGFTAPQITDEVGPGYVTAVTSREEANLNLSLTEPLPPKKIALRLPYHLSRWGRPIYVTVKGKDLEEGDTITVTYGAGFYQAIAQPVSQWMEFTIATDTRGDKEAPVSGYYLMANSPHLNVIGGSAAKLVITTRSVLSLNETSPVTVVARDKYDNVASQYPKSLTLTLSDHSPTQSYCLNLSKGRATLKNIRYRQVGKKRIEVSDPLSSLRGKSNPVLVKNKSEAYRIYWGDIHGHTRLSDGLGTLEEYYIYGRDMADLDFCATADHGEHMSDEDCFQTIKRLLRSNHQSVHWRPGIHQVHLLPDLEESG